MTQCMHAVHTQHVGENKDYTPPLDILPCCNLYTECCVWKQWSSPYTCKQGQTHMLMYSIYTWLKKVLHDAEYLLDNVDLPSCDLYLFSLCMKLLIEVGQQLPTSMIGTSSHIHRYTRMRTHTHTHTHTHTCMRTHTRTRTCTHTHIHTHKHTHYQAGFFDVQPYPPCFLEMKLHHTGCGGAHLKNVPHLSLLVMYDL